VNILINEGIRPQNIYVLNFPDLSEIPMTHQHPKNLSEITNVFNAKLATLLNSSTSLMAVYLEL
jgi:phospholipase/lecithinase/hemolysin